MRGLKQVDRPKSVYLKIDQRNVSRLIVRRLGRTVHYQVKSLAFKKPIKGGAVSMSIS